MKKLALVIMCACIMALNSCSNSDQVIESTVETAVHEAIAHVPAEFQEQLANYIDVGAKGVYSINGEPTVQELVEKVLAFLPQDVKDKYPLITSTITTSVSLMYMTYGKSALKAIGMGMEAGAAQWITHA